jgi:hypothetical protein
VAPVILTHHEVEYEMANAEMDETVIPNINPEKSPDEDARSPKYFS